MKESMSGTAETFKSQGVTESINIERENIAGDTAEVDALQVQRRPNDGPERRYVMTYKLVREGDEWKIDDFRLKGQGK